jgi:hypothetical protein
MNDKRLLIGAGLVVTFGIVLVLTHNKAATKTTTTGGNGDSLLVPSAPTLTPQAQEGYANGTLPAAGLSSNASTSMGSLTQAEQGITQIGPGLAVLNGDPSVSYEPLGLPAAQPTIFGV